MLKARALVVATVVGTVLQVGMVVSGHTNTSIAALFAPGGMLISLLAGLLYGRRARAGGTPASHLALGGLIAGGLCAFIGIAVSHLLGDVPASLLLLGTASSMVTGAIGGWLGALMAAKGAATSADARGGR